MKKLAIRLLSKLLGSEKFDYWAWNETPYPAGRPFWNQIWWGYKWALLPKGWVGKSPNTLAEEKMLEERRKEQALKP